MTLKLQTNVPLAPLTTIGIGGPAAAFCRATSIDDIHDTLDYVRRHGLRLFILGGGSNLLVADQGFGGLVLQIGLRGIEPQRTAEDSVLVKVAAGEPWDEFVAYAVSRGWAGVECLSGIPGSTGATPIQNVGAYGQEVSETIVRVEAIDRRNGHLVDFMSEECHFGYRSSLFKNEEPDRYVVVSVTFSLRPQGNAVIRYPELQRQLAASGIDLGDLAAVREAVIAIRRRKGMVIDREDADSRSDGSFFMNPVLDASSFATFKSHDGTGDAPAFPVEDGRVKLSAAWLIEHAGFQKGFSLGNAGLSSKHTLAVVNRGSATAADVLALVELIQSRVQQAFGVLLHPEPNFIGFDRVNS